MTSNRRRRYRVRLAPGAQLKAAVLRPGKEPVRGRIIDISASGIAIQFDPWRAPAFALREKVEVRLKGRSLPAPIVLPCLVRRRSELSEGPLYGFEFTSLRQLPAKLPAWLAKVFNRRKDSRVQVDPAEPMVVKVEGESSIFDMLASIVQVSPSGLSFWAPYAVENLLVSAQRVKVTFRLPNHPRELTFWSKILHRTLSGRGVTYGVAFDLDRTSQPSRKQAILSKYILERRRHLKSGGPPVSPL